MGYLPPASLAKPGVVEAKPGVVEAKPGVVEADPRIKKSGAGRKSLVKYVDESSLATRGEKRTHTLLRFLHRLIYVLFCANFSR